MGKILSKINKKLDTVGFKTLYRWRIFRPKIIIDHRFQIFIDCTSHNGNPGLVALWSCRYASCLASIQSRRHQSSSGTWKSVQWPCITLIVQWQHCPLYQAQYHHGTPKAPGGVVQGCKRLITIQIGEVHHCFCGGADEIIGAATGLSPVSGTISLQYTQGS